MKFNRKRALCEGVNTFFGKSNAYSRARKKGQIHVMYMVGEVARTSRRVVFLNRRFVFPTRRLVFSTRRVVKTSPGVVARKSGTLPHGATLWPRNLIPYIEQHLISFYL